MNSYSVVILGILLTLIFFDNSSHETSSTLYFFLNINSLEKTSPVFSEVQGKILEEAISYDKNKYINSEMYFVQLL